jgi:hypothetical protein
MGRGFDPSITAVIAQLAAETHGVVFPDAARRRGVTHAALDRRVGSQLRRTRRGCFVVPTLVDQWTPVVIATAASRLVAASHQFAAAAYQWDGFDGPLAGPPTFVAPAPARAGLPAERRRDLRSADLTTVGPIRVTSRLWTLGTLGEVVALGPLEQALECALRNRHVCEHQLWQWVATHRGPGRDALDVVLQQRGLDTPPTGSRLETLTLQLVLRPAAIPVLARQVRVFEGRTRHGRPDFLLPGWTILEVDGRQHADVSEKRRDNDRDLRLRGLGLTVVRLDYVQVTRTPTNSARRLVRAIGEGERAHGGNPPPLADNCLQFSSPAW